MRKIDNNRPLYNYYYEASSSSIVKMLMDDNKLYHGEWAELVVGDTPHMVVRLSRRDAAASPSQTSVLDITNTGVTIKGSVEPGFYTVTEVTDIHPDGVTYKAFCTGRGLYRCAVDFPPAHHLRLDRRIRTKPVTTGDLEELLKKASQDEGLKRALINLLKEDKKDEKKARQNPPKPAPTE